MENCKTEQDYADYFKKYNEEDPNSYCELALRKLTDLNETQKTKLNQIISDVNTDNLLKWDLYCNTLTISQINYVGW